MWIVRERIQPEVQTKSFDEGDLVNSIILELVRERNLGLIAKFLQID